MDALEKKAQYLKILEKAVPFLPSGYREEVKKRLPLKSDNRIKNARSGIIRDEEILRVLVDIAEEERVARRDKALEELAFTSKSLFEVVASLSMAA